MVKDHGDRLQNVWNDICERIFYRDNKILERKGWTKKYKIAFGCLGYPRRSQWVLMPRLCKKQDILTSWSECCRKGLEVVTKNNHFVQKKSGNWRVP